MRASPKTADHTRRLVLSAWAVGAAVSWNIANVGTSAGVVAEHYRISLPTVGLFASVMFGGQLVLQVPAGRLVDRLGPRNGGAVAVLAAVAGNLGVLVVPGFVPALLFRSLIGAAIGMGFVAGAASIRAVGGSSVAQGLYGGVCMGGAGAGIAVVGWLLPELGWTAPFVTAAAVGALALLVVLACPPVATPSAGSVPAIRNVLSDRRLAPFAAAHTATFGVSVIVGNWAVPLLLVHGGDRRAVAWIGSLTLGGALLGRPLGGWLSMLNPRSTRGMVVTSMLTGATGIVLLSAGGPLGVTVAGSFLIGLSAGLPFGPTYNAVTALRSDAPGLAASVTMLPAAGVILVGTPLVGWTFEIAGQGRLGFAGLAILWAATALVMPKRWHGRSTDAVGA